MAHEDIRARLAALPEGRWLAESVRDGDEDGYYDEETLTGRWMAEEEVDADGVPFWYESPSGAVAEFITRAADDLRTLLERVEELEASRNRAVHEMALLRGQIASGGTGGAAGNAGSVGSGGAGGSSAS